MCRLCALYVACAVCDAMIIFALKVCVQSRLIALLVLTIVFEQWSKRFTVLY